MTQGVKYDKKFRHTNMVPFTTLKKENWYAGENDPRDQWLNSTRESVIERNHSAIISKINKNRFQNIDFGHLERNRNENGFNTTRYRNDEKPCEPLQTSRGGNRGFHSGTRVMPQDPERVRGSKINSLENKLSSGQMSTMNKTGIVLPPTKYKPKPYIENHIPSAKGGVFLQQSVQEKYNIRKTRYFSEPKPITGAAFSKNKANTSSNFYEITKTDNNFHRSSGTGVQSMNKVEHGTYPEPPKQRNREVANAYLQGNPSLTTGTHSKRLSKWTPEHTMRDITSKATVGYDIKYTDCGELLHNYTEPDLTKRELSSTEITGGIQGSGQTYFYHSPPIKPNISNTLRSTEDKYTKSVKFIKNGESFVRNMQEPDATKKDLINASSPHIGAIDGSNYIHKVKEHEVMPFDLTRRDIHKINRKENPAMISTVGNIDLRNYPSVKDTSRKDTGVHNPVQVGSYGTNSIDTSQKRFKNSKVITYSGSLGMGQNSRGVTNCFSNLRAPKINNYNRDIISNRAPVLHIN